ncbi:MAG TPA: AsnC family transcriptional regulator, partial [Thalassospira sp.]|nr:AsnC family transcriptional regulator [Thalassospira sp.]
TYIVTKKVKTTPVPPIENLVAPPERK